MSNYVYEDNNAHTLHKKHYNSRISLGDNFIIHSEKHFNKLQKFMWKFLLNLDIIDVVIDLL